MRLHFDDIVYFAKNFPKILIRFVKGQIDLFETNVYFRLGLGFGMMVFFVLFFVLLALSMGSILVFLTAPVLFIFSAYLTTGLLFVLDKLYMGIENGWKRLVAWSEYDNKDKNKPKREVDTSRLEHIPRDNVDWQAEEGRNAHHK